MLVWTSSSSCQIIYCWLFSSSFFKFICFWLTLVVLLIIEKKNALFSLGTVKVIKTHFHQRVECHTHLIQNCMKLYTTSSFRQLINWQGGLGEILKFKMCKKIKYDFELLWSVARNSNVTFIECLSTDNEMNYFIQHTRGMWWLFTIFFRDIHTVLWVLYGAAT